MEELRITQKEIAVECLERLDIYEPYIKRFKSADSTPCFFEHYAGFYVDQEPELLNKIKEVETAFGCLVYAVTHELMDFGECWAMLCVSKYNNDISDCFYEFDTDGPIYSTYAYVWNKTNEAFSEFGDIVVRSFGGGIKRVG
jgi:hypothetical protein